MYDRKAQLSTILSLAGFVLASVTFAADFTAPSAPEIEAAAASFVLRPGVVVDPVRSTVYLMEPEGVVARDLASGVERWTSTAAAQPLGLHGGALIALAEPRRLGSTEIVYLALESGRSEAVIPATLPAGVGALIGDQPHRRFNASSLIADGVAHLLWSFEGRDLRGAPAAEQGAPGGLAATPPGSDSVSEKRLLSQGVFRLDPLARSADALGPGGATPRPRAAPSFDLAADETLAGLSGRQFRSADGRHVLVSERVADARTWARYRWTIYDQATGTLLGETAQPRSTAAFFVRGSRLFFESPPYLRRLDSGELESHQTRLVALDLASARDAWSVALRETEYRGPLPP